MSVFTREKPSKSPPSPCPNHLLSPPLCPGPDTYKGAWWKLQGRTKGPKRNCSRSQPVKQRSAPVLGFSCKSHVGISLACVLLYASCFNYVLQNRIQVTVQVYSFGDNFRWLGTKMDILIKKEEEDNITNKYIKVQWLQSSKCFFVAGNSCSLREGVGVFSCAVCVGAVWGLVGLVSLALSS